MQPQPNRVTRMFATKLTLLLGFAILLPSPQKIMGTDIIICQSTTYTINCPSGTCVSVSKANFGFNDAISNPFNTFATCHCDVLEICGALNAPPDGLVPMCMTQSCTISTVLANMCGPRGGIDDPCPNLYKTMRLSYTCESC